MHADAVRAVVDKCVSLPHWGNDHPDRVLRRSRSTVRGYIPPGIVPPWHVAPIYPLVRYCITVSSPYLTHKLIDKKLAVPDMASIAYGMHLQELSHRQQATKLIELH